MRNVGYKPLDPKHDLWAMSSGDRSTETNLKGNGWTRTNVKDAKCNAWPRLPSPYSLPRTTPALAGATPRNPTRKPRQARSDYLVARIARDRPDILERMKAGEFASVREAAREAGIIKDVSLVNQVVRLWAKATPEERQAIRQRMALDVD